MDIMRAELVAVEAKKGNKWNKVLWIIYICFIVLIGAMSCGRLVSLFRRIRWRNDLDGVFPAACGSWSENHGCTRVVLEEAGCVRPKDVKTENAIVFN